MSDVELSIIIPVATRDLELIDSTSQELSELLNELEFKSEVIWSLPETQLETREQLEKKYAFSRFIYGEAGRAQQLNKGAKESFGKVLWFLHVDSMFVFAPKDLAKAFQKVDDCKLYFFDFKFDYPNKALNRLTEFGVHFRSHTLGIPFGDQGFVLTKKTFLSLEGYSEDVAYGEDHVFVWSAKKAGIEIKPLGLSLLTSSDKYQKNGWSATTLKHFHLTWRQALPHLFSAFLKKEKGQ